LRGHCFQGGHRKLSTQFARRADTAADDTGASAIFPATAGSVRLGSPAREPHSRDFMRAGAAYRQPRPGPFIGNKAKQA